MESVSSPRARRKPAYVAPAKVREFDLEELLGDARPIPSTQQKRFGFEESPRGYRLWCAGEIGIVRAKCVSIVGTRKVSREGAARARRLARELVSAGVAVVSGLAEGVDTEAMTAAMNASGLVVGVIGTGIDRAYPAANAPLQERVWREHLLVSQFPPGATVFRSHFPLRNRLMAALSDATVIIEAGDTSGTLHQAAECARLGRPLFIARAVVEDRSLKWPAGFVGKPQVFTLAETSQILHELSRGR